MRTIAIANQKGGVGKTTTAVTLAHDLARKGHSVVLVDLDAQGNAAACLGLTPSPGLFNLLMGLATIDGLLVEARPDLWLLPGDATTAKLKTALAAEAYREEKLAQALDPLEADYCVIDCGPSRDLLHDLAHEAAELVVIPAAVDHLALIGVAQEMESIAAVAKRGHPLRAVAVVPTFWDSQTTESAVNLRALVDKCGDLVTMAVARTTRLREAPALGRTVWEHLAAEHPVCQAYGALTRRILSDGQ